MSSANYGCERSIKLLRKPDSATTARKLRQLSEAWLGNEERGREGTIEDFPVFFHTCSFDICYETQLTNTNAKS